MKYYYINPKTQDLVILEAETKELTVLERLMHVTVIGSMGGVLDDDYRGPKQTAGKPVDAEEHPSARLEKREKESHAHKCGKCGRKGHNARGCTQ